MRTIVLLLQMVESVTSRRNKRFKTDRGALHLSSKMKMKVGLESKWTMVRDVGGDCRLEAP